MIAEDPGYLASCSEFLFLLDVSSFGLHASQAFLFFRGPLAPASLDLACFFPFGPGSLFWASLTMILFRSQHLSWWVLLFYPSTTFGLVWVSFPDLSLVCWLPSHHHYPMLAMPHSIPKQKSFVLFFCSPWHSHSNKGWVFSLTNSYGMHLKFQFHLLGHNFLVEMDMSSFPRCSISKGKCSHILSYSDGQISFHNLFTPFISVFPLLL